MTPFDWIQWLLVAAHIFIVLASAVLGGATSGFLAKHIAALTWRQLSRAAVIRFRLLGGLLWGAIAYLLLGTVNLGGGFGFGPGEGGLPGRGPETINASRLAPDQPTPPATPPTRAEGTEGATKGTGGPRVLRVALLGETTFPAYQPKNRFFALANDPSPVPLDVDGVMRRLDELKQSGGVAEVRLVVSPGSTSLRNLEVQRLRREVEQAGVRFYMPDPENPEPTKPGA